jgi:hypothetical protein
LTHTSQIDILIIRFGAVAQLGERMTGSHEVVGSIPISSTKKIKGLSNIACPFFVSKTAQGAYRVHLGAKKYCLIPA